MQAQLARGGGVAASTRDRLLDVASTIVTTDGWSHVTMGRVAALVGVSRQTVYNELGTKDGLAEALVARETDRFLELVGEQLLAHGADMVAGITAAVRVALEHGADNQLIAAVVGAGHGRDDGLLPLLTTRPEPVLARAVWTLTAFGDANWAHLGLPATELHQLLDAVVRLTLSHLVQPQWPPEQVAELIGRLAAGACRAAHQPLT